MAEELLSQYFFTQVSVRTSAGGRSSSMRRRRRKVRIYKSDTDQKDDEDLGVHDSGFDRRSQPNREYDESGEVTGS